jgi:uncharacterized protein YifE (UPF0438 family)
MTEFHDKKLKLEQFKADPADTMRYPNLFARFAVDNLRDTHLVERYTQNFYEMTNGAYDIADPTNQQLIAMAEGALLELKTQFDKKVDDFQSVIDTYYKLPTK